jgi:hypothetical protein
LGKVLILLGIVVIGVGVRLRLLRRATAAAAAYCSAAAVRSLGMSSRAVERRRHMCITPGACEKTKERRGPR